MAEPGRNVANNSDDDESLIHDSADDEMDSDLDDNAMVTDSDDDERIANPNIAAHLNIPVLDQNYDPENNIVVDANNDLSDEAISDSEDEVANVVDEEMVTDSGDDSHNDDLADSDDENDDAYVNNFDETFHLNVEAEGLDVQLVAQDGNLQAVEKFVIIVAKTLRFKECYASMITSFKIANLG